VNRTPLPIDDVLGKITDRLRKQHSLVLRAPPGAGKTRRVPPAILDARLGEGDQVIVLEPRRIAARAAATRIAQERNCRLGDEVGYHVRFDRKAHKKTKILVMTDGLFVQRLYNDPFLDGVSAVIFDEFHERGLQSDLALAMTQRVREIRPDLKVVVMSATLDPAPIAAYLGDAATVESTGREYPVDVRYIRTPTKHYIEMQAVDAIESLLKETSGDILAFFPGVGEIRRAEGLLHSAAYEHNLAVMPLYGDMPLDAQQAVLAKCDRRKVVLATNVAESSITIDGITAVIDTGLARVLRHDQALGVNRLDVARISRASADQRAGRAGRTAPGICQRLWTEREHAGLAEREIPEIARVDLAGPVLELLVWGEAEPAELPWFEKPPAAAIEQAKALLVRIGAVGQHGKVSSLGDWMARLPLHPRLGRLLLEGQLLGVEHRAALAAAMLSERDPFRASNKNKDPRARQARFRSDSDVIDRVVALEAFAARRNGDEGDLALDYGAAKNVGRVARELIEVLPDYADLFDELNENAAPPKGLDPDDALLQAIAAAFADRIAVRREKGSRRALMVGGRGVRLDESSRVAEGDLFACIEIQEQGGAEALVRQASLVRREWLDPRLMQASVEVEFDRTAEKIIAYKRTRYLDLSIEQVPTQLPRDLDASELLAKEAAERIDLMSLLDDEASQFLQRVRSLAAWMSELNLPALTEDGLRGLWPKICAGCASIAEVRRRALLPILTSLLDGQQQAALNRFAPTRIEVPSGSHIALQYEAGKPPVLAVRIQELFGVRETPRVAGGRVGVVLHLLGPNYRPQQITADLASFWNNTYPEVRKELRRRYPKHAWPEDPWNATAERRPQRRK
jgi:ATP-dependent helicase HrpB